MRTFRNGAALALAIILNLSAQTWTNVATGTANDVVDVDFVDPQIGYMIDASDGIFRTTDAGATWNALTTGITGPSCVEFFNRNLGLIGAATGKIFRTTDGGATWTNVHSPGIAETITDIEYETETDVWAISSKGDLYKSVNGGESWTSSASSGAGYASDIHFLTNGLDALELDQNGRILLSQDDGLAWTVTLNVAHPLNDMCFIDNNLGYAVGETDSLFYTTDGGYSWSATDNVFPGENVTAIHFVDKRYGWAGTADGDLYFTEDEGVTFAYQETIQTASRIADIDFVHPNLGMAGAELGSLARFEGVNKFVQITDPEPFDDVTANRFEPLKWRSSGVDKAFVQIYEGGYTTIENDVDAATHSFLFKRNSAGTNRRFVVTDNANSQNSDVSDEPFEMLDPPGTGKWYVDDDATAGGDGSPGSPFATLASAFTAASSGDTIFVMPGKYVPTSTLNGMDYLVMIAPEGPRQTVIDGSSLPSWGITVMRGMWIEGFRFENHANGALLSRVLGGEGTPALVKGNIFANNGIAIVGQSDNLLSAIIVDNVFLKGTDSQILGVFPDAWIFHNVFYDNNSAAAPLIKLETTGITRVWADIRNNVFVGNSTTAADLANLNVTGEQVGNFYEGYNLFYNNSKNALTFYYDPLKSYLVHEASLGADLFVDPQFVDSAGWDFRSWAGTATESAGAVVGTFYPSKPPNIGLLNQSGSILSLEYPVGGENFTQGKSITITWGYSLVSNVDIDFSDDGGDTWTSVTTGLSAANMSYTFTAPTDVESAMCHIRITDADNPQSYDYNQTPFRVVAAQLDLSTFHEHMSLEPGTIHNVTWNSEGVTNVSLDYAPAIAGPWTLVDDNIAASGGSYDWTVPDLEGYNFYFRISNQANPTDGNDVRGPFSLLESFPLELATYDAGAGALYGVELVNATTAYVCGVGAAFRTTDLGETWANVSTGLGSEALYAMDFVNEETGWAGRFRRRDL